MQIGVGYEFTYDLPQSTPMLLTVSIHYSRASDLVVPDHLITVPAVTITGYRDLFGNWISRIVAPPGQIRLSGHAIVNDTGRPDPVHPDAIQHAVQDLPEETLLFLLGSRYCETDHLSEIAWRLFAAQPSRVGTCAGDLRLRTSTHQSSATSIRARPRLPGRHIRRAPACAGTSPTWQSPFAAA